MAGSLAISITAHAGSPTNCDKVASQVRADVEKDPAKVLIIVEDSMVANESCACEIVKAAILASKANGDMVKQIVLTATNVSPNMSKIIVECASAVAPEHAKDVESAAGASMGEQSGKGVKEVAPTTSDSGDYHSPTGSIQGVYLVQPSAGGVTPTDTEKHTTVVTKKVYVKKIVVKRTPPDTSTPQSPADSNCECPP